MNEPYLNNVPNEDHVEEINLGEYFRLLAIHKWSIIAFVVIVTLLTTLVVLSKEQIYKAQTIILIEKKADNIVPIAEVYSEGIGNRFLGSQIKILNSRNLAEQTIDALNLAKHPLFDPKQQQLKPNTLESILSWLPIDIDFLKKDNSKKIQKAPEYIIRNSIVGAFKSNLKIDLVPKTELLEISFESADKELTVSVPNKLVELYINKDIQKRFETTQKATNLINNRLGELKQNLDKSEKTLQAFFNQKSLIDVRGNVDSLTESELSQFTSILIQVRHRLNVTETAYQQIIALQRQGLPIEEFEKIPAILKDQSVRSARQLQISQENIITELKVRYGPKHPKMISAVDRLEKANQDIKKQIATVVESIEKEYQVTLAEERHLTEQMRLSKKGMNKLNSMTGELESLQRDVEANKEIYTKFLNRYKETSSIDEVQSVRVSIIDPAVLPSGPFKPRKKLIIMVSIVLSLIIGSIIVFLIEILDKTFKHPYDVEERLRLAVLAALPKLSIWVDKDIKLMRYYNDNNSSFFSESIRTIRTSALLSRIDDKQKNILITSSVPNEGKTVTAVNLALALGQLHNVLLMDCDLRKPSIAKAFDLSVKDVGLSDFVRGTHSLEKALYRFEKESITVMPSGTIPPNPLEMLSSDRFAKSFKLLQAKFDHIIIDSPPVIAVSDAAFLSSTFVNQVIYIIKANATPYPIITEGIKRLRNAHAPIVGAVLNGVDSNKKYYAGDEYSTYEYYGYKA